MKIISLNLAGRKDFGEKIEKRLEKIAAFLDSEKADVVCFQEVTFENDTNLAEIINQKLKYSYKFSQTNLAERFFSEKNNRETSDGIAILSSLPIQKHECFTLKPVKVDERGRPDYHKRIATLTEFMDFKIINTHLASNGNAHLQLQEILTESQNDILIIGDFNIFKSKMLNIKILWGDNYNCSIEYKDYISIPSDPPEYNTVDYLLLPKNRKFISIHIIEGLSDHNALIFEIQ